MQEIFSHWIARSTGRVPGLLGAAAHRSWFTFALCCGSSLFNWFGSMRVRHVRPGVPLMLCSVFRVRQPHGRQGKFSVMEGPIEKTRLNLCFNEKRDFFVLSPFSR